MKKESDYSQFPNAISLDVQLVSNPEFPGSAYAVFSFDVQAVFGTKALVPVVMTIDGKQFRRNLARYAGEYMIVFNRELRDATGYQTGDSFQLKLERDFAPRVVELPPELRAGLERAGVLPAWEKQSYSHQKEHLAWLQEAKREETRAKRLEQLVAKLREKN